MIASTFQMFAIAVLAASIIEDLGVSRWSLGIAGSLNTVVGAATAPFSGTLTDRIGPRRSVLTICMIGAVGMGIMTLATNLWWLIASSAVSGLAQGWGNPATNALIGRRVAPGRRGTITGIKQSGVTLALFLSGASLPKLSTLGSWHTASAAFAIIFAIFGVSNVVLLSRSTPDSSRTDQGAPTPSASTKAQRTPIPSSIKRMTVYAFLMGSSSGAIGRFLPLFAEEAVGMGRTSAGLLVALVGSCGIVFRIVAARMAEHRVAPQQLLVVLALVATVTSLLLMTATSIGPGVLWVIAVMYAIGHTAWNAVINFAIISTVDQRDAGRFSGIMMLGFLCGLSVSAPSTGWIVDTFDTYQPAWAGAAAAAFLGALTLWSHERRTRRTT